MFEAPPENTYLITRILYCLDMGDDHYIHHPILYIDKKFSDINTVRGIVCHQREAPRAKHLGTNLLTLLSIELRCMRSFLLCFFDKKKLYTVDVFDGCVKDFPRGGAFGVCGQAFGASILSPGSKILQIMKL